MNGDENLNRSFCPEHSMCMERLNNNKNEIDELKKKVKSLESDLVENKLKMMEHQNQILSLMENMKEIKVILKEISDKINKPDSFNSTLQKFGLEVLKWAMIGGLFIYFTKMQ